MTPADVRAIRGALTRVAFARLLGVSKLTVLRWELPEDNKESRRPRPNMVAALQDLAREGVGAASEPGEEDAREIERTTAEFQRDELIVLPLLERLHYADWKVAEGELSGLLASSALGTEAGRALARIGIAQMELLARSNLVRSFELLTPILEKVELGSFPNSVAARAHVVAAVLFGWVDTRFCDQGRCNAHAMRAEELLGEGEDDLRIFIAVARVMAARYTSEKVGLTVYRSYAHLTERASSPLAQLLAASLRSIAAQAAGDTAAVQRLGMESLVLTQRLGLRGLEVVFLVGATVHMHRGAQPADAMLGVTEMVRRVAGEIHLPFDEFLLCARGAEISALCRLARLAEAAKVADEAMATAKAAGIPRHVLAWNVAELYLMQGRVSELDALADELETDSVAPKRGRADLHALVVRALAEGLMRDAQKAADQLEMVCGLPDTTPGWTYLAQVALTELAHVKLVLRDKAGADQAIARLKRMNADHPWVAASGHALRLRGHSLLLEGRLHEARRKFEASLTTFASCADAYQQGIGALTLAMVAVAMGAPDGQDRLEGARRQLARHFVLAPELTRRWGALAPTGKASRWAEQTLPERLLIAVERMSAPGVDPDPLGSSVVEIIRDLLPGRTATVGSSDLRGATFTIQLPTGPLALSVPDLLDPDERAALRLFTTMAAQVSQRRSPAMAGPPIDALLPNFVAVAEATRKLKAEVASLASSASTILVTGESGVGKEIVARALHDLSPRKERPYIVLNCASVPRELFESQLFGHRKGSFSGATADNPGVVRAADGGTLFLDEIGELPLDMQPKLLRFLENNEVLPIGEQSARRVDVRVVAATHRDLGELVRAGKFRGDLFYRLNVVPVRVAPLRERPEDIVALARQFAARTAVDGAAAPVLSSDAITALQEHTWPGNARELRNVIERTMAYAPAPRVLQAHHLRIQS